MIWMMALLFSQAAFSAEATVETISFEKAELKIKDKIVHAKIADTEERREHGLMFVKKLGPNEGMLFVFNEEHVLNFWMKNTLIPLSIGFFDQEGVLVSKMEMDAGSLMERQPKNYSSNIPALFALEMPKGWFTRNHIEIGARIALAGPTKSALLKQKIQSAARQTSSGRSQ